MDVSVVSLCTEVLSYMDVSVVSFCTEVLSYMDVSVVSFCTEVLSYMDISVVSFCTEVLSYMDVSVVSFCTEVLSYMDVITDTISNLCVQHVFHVDSLFVRSAVSSVLSTSCSVRMSPLARSSVSVQSWRSTWMFSFARSANSARRF